MKKIIVPLLLVLFALPVYANDQKIHGDLTVGGTAQIGSFASNGLTGSASLVVLQNSTQVVEDNAVIDIAGTVTTTDGMFGATDGETLEYKIMGTKTNGATAAAFTVGLQMGETGSETQVISLGSVDTDAGNWYATINVYGKTTATQDVYGCLYQNSKASVCSWAETTVDMTGGTAQDIEATILAGHADDTVTIERITVSFWEK